MEETVCKGLNWGKGIEENQCDVDAVSTGHCGFNQCRCQPCQALCPKHETFSKECPLIFLDSDMLHLAALPWGHPLTPRGLCYSKPACCLQKQPQQTHYGDTLLPLLGLQQPVLITS
ncbi:hypothetical protein MG293_010695 [Ovis ammon polii]|uniref:Uncharacterized protein n=1 Tax=Ovis ammon polii TaxID=230172 RepID=A0AAD4U4G9_OVIAM|nr:hypothetical protein MG293_010695 [Ovis ammon polii]